jgi:hypothetical protein
MVRADPGALANRFAFIRTAREPTTLLSLQQVACALVRHPGDAHMRSSMPLVALLLTGCVVPLDLEQDKPLQRAVHTGERAPVGYFYALKPTCEVEMLPEITVLKEPRHGSVSFETGEEYPHYGPSNIRSACNRNPAPGTLLFYQSTAGFEGGDSLQVRVRYPGNHVRTIAFEVSVR